MILESFEHYLNAHKKSIQIICSGYEAQTTYRIEYEDLYQEAMLKLFELYTNGKPLDINYSLKAIKHRIIDYIRKNSKDSMLLYGVDNLLYSQNEREDER